MRDLALLFVHLVVTLVRLAGPGGVRSVVAESLLVNHQLVILNRPRKRAPSLRVSDRLVAGLYVPDTPRPLGPFGNRPKAFDFSALPPGLKETKVSPPFRSTLPA